MESTNGNCGVGGLGCNRQDWLTETSFHAFYLVEPLGPRSSNSDLCKLGEVPRGDRKFRQTRKSSIQLLERPARVWRMPAEIKCLLCRRKTALTCRDSVGSREAVNKFIIAAICIIAMASNAPTKDKKHLRATRNAHAYQGAIMRFPHGNGFIFSIGPFPIMIPPFIVQSEASAETAARVNHP